MGKCCHCGGDALKHHNYCSWQCHIDAAKAEGGRVRCPNGLPINCILANGDMLEVSHGDHETYIFPVVAEYLGEVPEDAEDDEYFETEEHHALIYTDGNVALTLYECNHYVWHVSDNGRLLLSHYSRPGEWRLNDESLSKINAYWEEKVKQ
jgi:hypothetical protein